MIAKILVSILLFSSSAIAGQIRTIHMNADKMRSVNLKMGQSTVLRFTDKPKKIVIGNQNYYSVEFIENDVTIQPLGRIKTNLFVYTSHHVYGFVLNPNSGSNYDDIVNVRWSSQGIVLKQRRRVKSFKEKRVGQRIGLKSVSVDILKVIINDKRGTHIIDFLVTNNTAKTIESKSLDFFLTKSGKRLKTQEFALISDELDPFHKIRGRLLVKLAEKSAFSFNVKHLNESARVIIHRRYL